MFALGLARGDAGVGGRAAGDGSRPGSRTGSPRGEVREIIGAVDETFLERMMLVFMDLATGYLLLEEVADDRTYATWKALVDERLKALGTGVLYLVSDRAKALIQLAEQGLECLSMPDFFHVIHEIIKSYSLALGRHLRQAHQELTKATGGPRPTPGTAPQRLQDDPEAKALVAARQAEVTRWEEAHHTYRHHLETLSLTLHPFRIADSAPQTSAQVASHLQAAVEAIEAFAQRHQLPARHAAMTKVRKQLPALAALVDFWWARGQAGFGARGHLPHVEAVGGRVPCSRWSIGSTKWPTRAVPGGKPRYGRPWRRCKPPLTSMRSPNGLPPRSSRSGKRGRPTG